MGHWWPVVSEMRIARFTEAFARRIVAAVRQLESLSVSGAGVSLTKTDNSLSIAVNAMAAVARQSQTVVRVQNETGSALNAGQVVGLDTLAQTQASHPNTWRIEHVFKGVTPTLADHAGRFAVMLDRLEARDSGDAVAMGMALVKVDVAAESDTFADVSDGDVSMLASGTSGGASIIWKESGTGERWALVRIGNPSAGMRLRYGAATADWAGGNTTTLTPCVSDTDDTATGEADVLCFLQWPDAPVRHSPIVSGMILPFIDLASGNGLVLGTPALPQGGTHRQLGQIDASGYFVFNWTEMHG